MLPVIGIAPAYMDGKQLILPGEGNDLYYLYTRYVNCIAAAGGLPVILPPLFQETLILAQVERIQGLLISGGRDFLPSGVKEEILVPLRDQSPLRYDYECILLDMALALDLPVLGICRGHQMMGVWGGSSFYVDLGREVPSAHSHHQANCIPHHTPSHPLLIEPDSLLFHIFQKREIMVNSLHRQAIKTAGPHFFSSGFSDDGIVEAIEGSRRFFLGLQFHPELLINDPQFSVLFTSFVQACQEKMCSS